MKFPQKYLSAPLIGITTLVIGISPVFAATAPSLGTASSYAVLSARALAKGAVTCTDATITGNVGSSGFPSGVTRTRCLITGAIVAPVSAKVLADFNSAYYQLANNRCDKFLTGTLAGAKLAPGVYCFASAAALTGTLTLNGPSNGVWIFLINGALTGNSASVILANGGQARNVFWGTTNAATMTSSNFKGTILAGAAITVTGGTFVGRALATKGVTMTGVAATGFMAGY